MKRSCPTLVDFWIKITVRLVPLGGAQVLSVVGATVVTDNDYSYFRNNKINASKETKKD